jgi:hypothetical protein
MLFLYTAADAAATLLFVVLGTWALFYLPPAQGRGLVRRLSPGARRTLARALGCVFSTWGFARLFAELRWWMA